MYRIMHTLKAQPIFNAPLSRNIPLLAAVHTSSASQTLHTFLDENSTCKGKLSATDYSTALSDNEPEDLQRIRTDTMKADPKEAFKMISPLQGNFMKQYIQSIGCNRVLELGCYVGYSAGWIAKGLGKGGFLWTCEKDTKVSQIATRNIEDLGLSNQVKVLNRPAIDVIKGWGPEIKLDMVFIDANKSGYKEYYDEILNRDILSPNGVIIVDNVLFHGKVHTLGFKAQDCLDALIDDGSRRKPIALKIHEFNRYVAQDPRTSQVLLPVFDGIMIIRMR